MKTDPLQLVRMWEAAIALKNEGDWQDATRLLELILVEQPSWEHGYGHFNLAECYEGAKRIREADAAYRLAVLLGPTDPTLLGGLASFLYLHGKPMEAFDAHARLYMLELKRGDVASAACTATALKALGSRLGWSEDETMSQARVRSGVIGDT